MNIDYKLIGSRIKKERIKQGLTQESLAERLDVSIGYVSQVERGITKISLDLLGAISAILECDVAHFIMESATNSQYYMAGTPGCRGQPALPPGSPIPGAGRRCRRSPSFPG